MGRKDLIIGFQSETLYDELNRLVKHNMFLIYSSCGCPEHR